MGRPRKYQPVEKACPHCGSVFQAATPYAIQHQQFCTRRCRDDARKGKKRSPRVERPCRNCGKVLAVLPCQLATKHFCSYACSSSFRNRGENNPAWKGGHGNRGRYWKRRARERDDFACQYVHCAKRDTGKGTHAHHRIPRAAGGEDTLENLVTLCSQHHHEIERQLLAALVARFPDATREELTTIYAAVLA